MQTETIDYRAFCEAIGAAKDIFVPSKTEEIKVDPAFKKFVAVPTAALGENALHKL